MPTPRTALFPGSFDPPTLGHVELVERGLRLFDRVVIALGVNSAKQTMFPLDRRADWLRATFAAQGERVQVASYDTLTARYAREAGAACLLRGLRNALDMEYERSIDHLNKHLEPEIETLYLISSPQTAHISSTLVREIIRHGGRLEGLLPPVIIQDLRERGL